MKMLIPCIVVYCCLYCLTCEAAPRKQSSERVVHVDGMTRLRSSPPAMIVSTGRTGRELRYVNVEVRNAGHYPARGVQVFATCGAGLMVPLQGPKSLLSGQRALYISRAKLPVIGSSTVSVSAACANCRR